MLTAEQNAKITRIGPGTPAGAVMRRYWQPVALSEELAGNRPLRALGLLGESLVLFRDAAGRLGLMARQCCHRGADLAFGRLEAGGLRCAFHGWLYDVEGRCLEQPAEPEGSAFHAKVRQRAYPCAERNGVIFAYLGPGAPPPLPALDCFAAPETHSFAFKGYLEANWLQAVEVGIDPAHASYLHRFFEDADPDAGYGQQFRAATASIPLTKVLRELDRPRIEVERTGYGLRILTLRKLDAERLHIRVTNQVLPHAIVIPMSEDMIITQWHVPVDDASCYWYALFTAYREPVDKRTMREQRLAGCTLPDYKPRRNKANEYGFDAEEQRTRTFTGMGHDINVHDQWAVESPGPIQDRTQEHLGSTDKAIAAYRRLLFDLMDKESRGEALPYAGGDSAAGEAPLAIDTIGPASGWQEHWRREEQKRRAHSAWAASP
jgi:nitrite reductase/ring-hydroxylating ferredoxin subunit